MSRFRYLSNSDIKNMIGNSYDIILDSAYKSFDVILKGEYIQPEKHSIIIEELSQNRINAMPAYIKSIDTAASKWVSVFPNNKILGIQNVESFTILSETENGKVKSIMNSSLLTSLRTAAVGALAARYLAKSSSSLIGFIGCGEEAKAHFRMIKHVIPNINKCNFSARSIESVEKTIKELKMEYSDVEFTNCGSDHQKSVSNADIIVTAISSQEAILKADWITPGTLYIHVAGLEDEFDVVRLADKIVCDSWEAVKHRTQTISQMYKLGLLADSDIYADLGEIISGNKSGRVNDKEFIYFNSVGLAIIDVILANDIYMLSLKEDAGKDIEK